MLYGLPRKIRTAFLLQTLLASLAGLLGGYLILLVIKFGLVNALLKPYFDSGELHSLQMQTMTPDEWSAARG